MNAPSMDVKTILCADGALGLTFATNVFVSEMPPTPDACVSIIDTGGWDDVMPLDTGVDCIYERPTVQVLVRGRKGAFVEADALARRIKAVLHGQHGVEVNGSRYLCILVQGSVSFIAYDDSRRPLIAANYRLDRTDVPAPVAPPMIPYMMPAGRRGEGGDD